MAELRVPKLNNNDTRYLLVEWIVQDGQFVKAGEPVAVLETSKAAEDIVAGDDGILAPVAEPGREYGVGDLLARLFATEAERTAFVPDAAREPGAGAGDGTGPVISKPAQELAERLGIAPERLRELPVPLVRRSDVERLAAAAVATAPAVTTAATVTAAATVAEPESAGPAAVGPQATGGERVVALSRAQRAVGAVVAESHRTIPAAFVAVTVRVGAARSTGRRLSRRYKRLIGVPELVVKAVADRYPEFPLCFGGLTADGAAVRVADAAHVGVTVDVGRGLFVPVVRAADRLGLDDVAAALMDHRMTALRGTFRPADLAGGAIMVALHTDADVSVAVPVVFPGQSCAVSVAAARTELALDPDGAVVAEPVVQLGLAYDHRVLNGRDAVAFLTAVKAAVEAPERWEDGTGAGHTA